MKKRFFIGLFIATTISLFIYAHIVLDHNNEQYKTQTNLQAPIEIPAKEILTIQEAEKLNKPIVAMFYVDWCSFCRNYMPTFAKFAQKYKNDYTFAAINCDMPENIQKVKDFHIMAFPSLFIIDNKINHKFTINLASTTDEKIMEEELNSYLAVRKNIRLCHNKWLIFDEK